MEHDKIESEQDQFIHKEEHWYNKIQEAAYISSESGDQIQCSNTKFSLQISLHTLDDDGWLRQLNGMYELRIKSFYPNCSISSPIADLENRNVVKQHILIQTLPWQDKANKYV